MYNPFSYLPRLPRRTLAAAAVVLFVAVLAAGVTSGGRTAAAPIALSRAPLSTFAATTCNRTFFGLRTWYYYMPKELGQPQRGDTPADPCAVRCFNIFLQKQPNDCGQKASDIPAIILAIVDDLLRIAGLVAVVFVLIGSFEFIGSRGNAERTASAQSTVIGALVGLAISMVAVGLVAFIGNQLGS